MLCVPVEQAVTMHMFEPRMPVSIAIWPDAVSGSMLAMKNGLTVRAPFVSASFSTVLHQQVRDRRRPSRR